MDTIFEEQLLSLSKCEFFEEWLKHSKGQRNSHLFEFIKTKFHLSDISNESLRELKLKIASYSVKISDKWTAAGKSKERFMTKNRGWLDTDTIQFRVSTGQPRLNTSAKGASSSGRPRKSFDESSFKTKKRRVEDLVKSRSVNELMTAAEIVVRLTGQRNVANVLRDIGNCPEQVSVFKKPSPPRQSRQLSGDEALAYFVDSKSTTHTYKQTRKWSKKACYPSEEHIFVTETRAEIKLQAILDKTVQRLVQAQSEVVKNVFSISSFILTSKWGCDGSSGHSSYKQSFENTEATDEFLFVFSFVPIKLHDDNGHNTHNTITLWQNPRPSSTMFCRPIKFIFAKETNEFTTDESNKVLEEISHLLPTICNIGDSEISVRHELLLTMIDGKVCNALTENRSSQKCYICGASPKMMNGDTRHFESNKENLGFGLSTLHAWIRCFECLLHISYRLNIKTWQVKGFSHKANVKQRSDEIKQRFKHELDLIVDKPKPGFGSTNDGNTARHFFGNPELSARITGLDDTLIKNFDTLLRTLSSGFEINIVEFDNLCPETRNIYLRLYSWYFMPATVHKILVRSTEVIKTALLPIGQLSEEAQEARNKDYRRFREHNTRKRSRITTNRDLLNMLVITSDPLINSLREIPKKKAEKLHAEVLKLIVAPMLMRYRNLIQVVFR